VKENCPAPPAAISFAFLGPADYPNGIIGDLHNLPGFRGGVALGPMLEEKFEFQCSSTMTVTYSPRNKIGHVASADSSGFQS